jgi:DNA-binding Lrp family transcriptional regulator
MAMGDDVRFTETMYVPDTLNLRITKELSTSNSPQYDVRESYARVAKRLGVDEETVRKRIRRQEKFGILQGWRAAIHPNLIGCVDVLVDIQVEGDKRKKEVLSELRLLEGMIAITNFEGNGLYLLLYAEPGKALSRKIQLIRTICGTNEYNWASSLPPCNLKLSETDWRIVWSLRNDPRKNLSEIAKDAKVTTRTVNRRLNFLTEHRALFLVGLPNFKQTTGVTANFLIICSDKEKKSSVSREVVSKFANIAFAAPGSSYLTYNIYFHNISEAEAAHEWIGKLEGVEKARLGIIKELMFVWDWLDDQMQKRLVDSASCR